MTTATVEITARNFGRRIFEIEGRVTDLVVATETADASARAAAAREGTALVYEAGDLARRFPFAPDSDGEIVIAGARERIRRGVLFLRRKA